MSFNLRSIESPAWQKVLDLEDQKRALGDDVAAIPTGKWNRLVDRLNAAIDRAVHESDLLNRLRGAVPDITDPIDRAFVHRVIAPLVVRRAEDIETVRNDPRVALTDEELIGEPALYLAENSDATPESIYRWDIESLHHSHRDLSRIGGTPTRVPEVRPPDDPFLLQIDLRAIWEDASANPPVLRLLESHGVPSDGLLQVFHATTGDSRTDPDVAGGGAPLMYLSETSLGSRLPVDLDADCAVYLPSRVHITFGLSFRDGPSGTERSSLTVVDLQRIADIWARRLYLTDQYKASTDPFSATELPVTRVFGVPSYDFDLDEGDLEVLNRDLPLTSGDHHMLFLNIAGEQSFDTVFGDTGRLEIWIRDSDLRAARFEDAVSFIRSA